MTRFIQIILCFLSIFQTAESFSQDRIFYNGKIFTGNREEPFVEAVAVRGQLILGVGSISKLKEMANPGFELIDLHGKCLLPGFIDSHIHAVKGGISLTRPNLEDEYVAIDKLKDFVTSLYLRDPSNKKKILTIYGVHIATWNQTDSLNQVFSQGDYVDLPIFLKGSDGHTGWINQACRKYTGIQLSMVKSLPEKEQEYYGLDNHGELNGMISEKAVQNLATHYPDPVDEKAAAKKMMEYTGRYGITAWLDPSAGNTDDSTSSILDHYKFLADHDQLEAHVVTTIVADPDAAPGPQITSIQSLQEKYQSPNLQIKGFKIFADGVIEYPTHTAALSIPYTGTKSSGRLLFDPEKFKFFAAVADQQGWLIHIHAIGDRAVTESLNVLEYARAVNHNHKIPHTLTHLQIIRPEDIPRFKSLDILCSMQLHWAFGDVTTIDIVQPYIDSSLFKWQYPAYSLFKNGAIICGASDWPVSTANPFEAIYHATTRKGPKGILNPEQRMPRTEMFYAYTIHSAKALMMENEIGSIEKNKWADLVLVDRDVFTCSEDSLLETKIIWTMFKGKKIYELKGK